MEDLNKLREGVSSSLLMAENYQKRCHEAENLLFEFSKIKWWEFKKRKGVKEKFDSHYFKWVNVNFGTYFRKEI